MPPNKKTGVKSTKKRVFENINESKLTEKEKKRYNDFLKNTEKINCLKNRSFGIQRLSDAKLSAAKKAKVRNFHVIKSNNKNTFQNTFLVYKDGLLYRNIPEETYRLWQELLRANLPVEQIEGVATSKEIRSLKKLGCVVDKGEVIVKTRLAGLSLDLYATKQNSRVITLNSLIKKQQFKKIGQHDRMSIVRQATEILIKLWDLGYTHSHPHVGNWAIDYVNGIPKVTLIDFDLLLKLENINFVEKQLKQKQMSEKAIKETIERFKKNKIFVVKNDLKWMKFFIFELNIPDDYSKRIISLLEKKCKKTIENYEKQ